jgi:hypothetical protein
MKLHKEVNRDNAEMIGCPLDEKEHRTVYLKPTTLSEIIEEMITEEEIVRILRYHSAKCVEEDFTISHGNLGSSNFNKVAKAIMDKLKD